MKTLREAAQAVVDRWEGSLWEDAPTIVHDLKEALLVPDAEPVAILSKVDIEEVCAALEQGGRYNRLIYALRRSLGAGWPYTTPQPAAAPEPLFTGLISQHKGLGEEIREVFAVPKLNQDEILDMAEGVTLQFHDLLKFARAIEAAIHAKMKGNTP